MPLPTQVTIRTIERKDDHALGNIIRGVIEEFDAPRKGTVYEDTSTLELSKYFNIKNAKCWVAEKRNELLGCGGIYPTPGLDADTLELVKLYLKKDARGLGIGKALIKNCIAEARKLGFKKLYLESIPEFDSAIGLYKSVGFKSINSRLGQSGHHNCNIWMLMELN